YDPKRRNILVLGNSQVGEGFSVALADASSGRADLHFVNGAIPGTSPRVWYYLLRALDPDAKRFAAIALMLNYNPIATGQDVSNYPLDTRYALSLLRLGDTADFPASFGNAEQRTLARRSILLPLQAMHEDVIDALGDPLKRYERITVYRPAWLEA